MLVKVLPIESSPSLCFALLVFTFPGRTNSTSIFIFQQSASIARCSTRQPVLHRAVKAFVSINVFFCLPLRFCFSFKGSVACNMSQQRKHCNYILGNMLAITDITYTGIAATCIFMFISSITSVLVWILKYQSRLDNACIS
jgi:hypothetical protein